MRKHSLDNIFNFIIQQTAAHNGRVPTRREIAAGCGISSLSVLDSNITALVRQGRLRLEPGRGARNITIPGGKWIYEPGQ